MHIDEFKAKVTTLVFDFAAFVKEQHAQDPEWFTLEATADQWVEMMNEYDRERGEHENRKA